MLGVIIMISKFEFDLDLTKEMNATVLDNAEIGEGAIIAAGAVVLHDTKVPPYEIWAGIPAKCVKKAGKNQSLEFARHYLEIKTWY